ncbi:MAG: hypothetical protein OSJ46_07430 [Duncaniella sp.]|nr:hypothetical protein [Duncaniella sp.]
MLYPSKEIANFKTTRIKAVNERSCLSNIDVPDKGTSIFDMAWEWTVYSLSGVWRCLLEINKNIILRFFCITT